MVRQGVLRLYVDNGTIETRSPLQPMGGGLLVRDNQSSAQRGNSAQRFWRGGRFRPWIIGTSASGVWRGGGFDEERVEPPMSQ